MCVTQLPAELYHILVSATLGTITFTTLFMAPITRPLIRYLKLGDDLSKGIGPPASGCGAGAMPGVHGRGFDGAAHCSEAQNVMSTSSLSSLEVALLTDPSLRDFAGSGRTGSGREISTLSFGYNRTPSPPPHRSVVPSPPTLWFPPGSSFPELLAGSNPQARPGTTLPLTTLPLTTVVEQPGRSDSVESKADSLRGTVLSPDEDEDSDREQTAPSRIVQPKSPLYRKFRRFEAEKMKPIFGGSKLTAS